MKILKSVLIIIVVLGITVTFLKITGERKTELSEVHTDTTTPNGIDQPSTNGEQLCYIWNTEAGDKATLSMFINGSNVKGNFDWLPVEKDKKTGTFSGIFTPTGQDNNSRFISALWDTQAEGMNNTEGLNIKFDDTRANPGFGEMEEDENGVYLYADSTKIDYSLNLQRTDCGDSSMN